MHVLSNIPECVITNDNNLDAGVNYKTCYVHTYNDDIRKEYGIAYKGMSCFKKAIRVQW